MAMTVQQVVSALSASDRTAVVSMRSRKREFFEVLNDYAASTENNFSVLGGHLNPDGAIRLVLIVDIGDNTDTGAVKVERRV